MTKPSKIFLDLNRITGCIPGHTRNYCDELPLPRPMARRTPNALISEDIPPVRHMGNWLQQGMHFWPNLLVVSNFWWTPTRFSPSSYFEASSTSVSQGWGTSHWKEATSDTRGKLDTLAGHWPDWWSSQDWYWNVRLWTNFPQNGKE